MTGAGWLARASRYGVFAVWTCAAALVSCRKNVVGTSDDGEVVRDSSRGNPGAVSRAARAVANQPGSGPSDSAERDAATTHGASPSAPFEPAAIDAGGLIPATARACRVMALRGTARAVQRFSGTPGAAADAESPHVLARGDLVPEGRVIELDADSELTAHATVSTREITLVGPATAEVCPGGDEAVRLARGRVTAFPGAGVRPGADVWVATPLGVVRFNDAKLEISVPDFEAARLDVTVVTGRATFVAAPGVFVANAVAPADAAEKKIGPFRAWALDEAIPLVQGAKIAARRREGPTARWVLDLLAACVHQASAARQAADRMIQPRDAGREALADLASAHIQARQQARAACETVWAAGSIAPALLDGAHRSELERADAIWKGAPAPPGAYQLTPLPARR